MKNVLIILLIAGLVVVGIVLLGNYYEFDLDWVDGVSGGALFLGPIQYLKNKISEYLGRQKTEERNHELRTLKLQYLMQREGARSGVEKTEKSNSATTEEQPKVVVVDNSSEFDIGEPTVG